MANTIHVRRIHGDVDFAIITVREDEYEAVLQRFRPNYPVVNGQQLYRYCRMRRPDGRSINVAIVRMYDQGQGVAQQVATETICDLDPRWLVLTGIAGGLPDSDFSLGDVLLANRLHDFCVTAALEDKPMQYRPAGGPMHAWVERLLGVIPSWRDELGPWNLLGSLSCPKPAIVVPSDIKAACFYGPDETRKSVQTSLLRHFAVGKPARPPLFRVGGAATANVLLKDTSLLAEWKKLARQITHVEMEAGGVYIAARHPVHGNEVPMLCVRGISDIVGFKRGEEWTAFACHSAAALLHAMVTVLPVEYFRKQTFPLRARDTPGQLKILAERCWNTAIDVVTHALKSAGQRLSGPSLATPSLEDIARAFRDSSSPLLSHVVAEDDRMPRSELTDISSFVEGTDERVLFVLGSPGSGKTALLALFARNALDAGQVTLTIKADLLPTDLAFETWGRREIGLELTAIDAVRAAATQSKVLVVIDQLDALASTVDLTSTRLNAIIDFIHQCTLVPGVRVVCSCRSFDFNNDARFGALNAKEIELELPSWEDVSIQLTRHGVSNLQMWPPAFRELLRTPQHLDVYLRRFTETNNTDAFGSYYALLDDLWERDITSDNERKLIYELTEYLIENELLWAPVALFEGHSLAKERLVAKNVLQLQKGQIGFRHQTLLEHAKARLFTSKDKSLCDFVLEKGRQDSILVRPTVWAVLRYLRDVNATKYKLEIQRLFSAQLRLHMRFLLIEFLGQVPHPEDFEIALLAQRLSIAEERVRVLIAIRGSSEWFEALSTTHLPVVMQGPMDEQWPMTGIIAKAWEFSRERCFQLVESNWLPNPEKDRLTISAMRQLKRWDDRAIDIVLTLIRRAEVIEGRITWAEFLVDDISQDQPTLAPKVFIETIKRTTSKPSDGDVHQDSLMAAALKRNPLEHTRDWYGLPDVADAAPLEFLKEGWNWLVEMCEQHHTYGASPVIYQYTGSCMSLEERENRPESPILAAFLAAIDAVSETSPAEFVNITKPTWKSENAVVHRLIVRGLCHVVRWDADIGLQYIAEDRRRLWLGTYESNQQSESISLIRALSAVLAQDRLKNLEQLIVRWTMYREGIELGNDQKTWDREARLRLLTAIPAELMSIEVSQLVQQEKSELPGWDRQRESGHSGHVYHIPPITKDEMLNASKEEVLEAITNSPPEGVNHKWVEEAGHWEEAGGAPAAGNQLAELAKDHPYKAVELATFLVANGNEIAATEVWNHLAETSLTDDEIFDFVRTLAKSNPQAERLRSNVAYLLYRRCKGNIGLPDDLCDILKKWLAGPWDTKSNTFKSSDSNDTQHDSDSPTPLLWASGGGLVSTDLSFWILLALTHGYLMRNPADCDRWLDVVDEHLVRDISEATWAAYCSELKWIRLKPCKKDRGIDVIAKLFERFPQLGLQREGVILVAMIADLLPKAFLEKFLDNLRSSTHAIPRQAYGELLAVIALRYPSHEWVAKRIEEELSEISSGHTEESIAVGIAFAAANLWDDDTETRLKCARILAAIVPATTKRIGAAIGTVFWAKQDFAVDESTDILLRALAANSHKMKLIPVWELVEHLVPLVVHKRQLILEVSRAIVHSGRQEGELFEGGPNLVKIAMTLQRFDDTRSGGLSLFEDLLRLGLDDAFRILEDIDLRPSTTADVVSSSRPRRRRRKRRADKIE